MILNILKFVLGFLLAIVILAAGSFVAALYVMNRTSIPPAKPIFANDKPLKKVQQPTPKAEAANPKATRQAKIPAQNSPSPTPTPSASLKPLPAGAYQARITWNQGLVLRSEPNSDAERIGGVGFNQKVFVLERSPDKAWQKIRVEGSAKEGWIKSGNTKQIDRQNGSRQPKQSEPIQQPQ
jgi:uncharacterized protein YgiM (DUF1202 family)